MRMWTGEGFSSMGALLQVRKWIRKDRTARLRSTCTHLDFIMVARDLQRQTEEDQHHRVMKKALVVSYAPTNPTAGSGIWKVATLP